MVPSQVPRHGDVVVRKDTLDGAPFYVLYTAPGPDQYLARAREDAAARAVAYATRAQVDAWSTDCGAVFVPLARRRRRSLNSVEHGPAIRARIQRPGGLESLMAALSAGNHGHCVDNPTSLADPSTSDRWKRHSSMLGGVIRPS